jgi:hypothetical protein
MAKLFLTPINMSNLEVQNLRLHQSQPSVAVEGGFYYDTTAKRPTFYDGTAWLSMPSLGSGTPAAETVAATAVAGTSLLAARLDHVHAMPGLVTTSVNGFMSATDKTKLDNATSANTASTLVIRDAASRFRAANPSDTQDVATKNYVDALIGGVTDWKQSAPGSEAE